MGGWDRLQTFCKIQKQYESYCEELRALGSFKMLHTGVSVTGSLSLGLWNKPLLRTGIMEEGWKECWFFVLKFTKTEQLFPKDNTVTTKSPQWISERIYWDGDEKSIWRVTPLNGPGRQKARCFHGQVLFGIVTDGNIRYIMLYIRCYYIHI